MNGGIPTDRQTDAQNFGKYNTIAHHFLWWVIIRLSGINTPMAPNIIYMISMILWVKPPNALLQSVLHFRVSNIVISQLWICNSVFEYP